MNIKKYALPFSTFKILHNFDDYLWYAFKKKYVTMVTVILKQEGPGFKAQGWIPRSGSGFSLGTPASKTWGLGKLVLLNCPYVNMKVSMHV